MSNEWTSRPPGRPLVHVLFWPVKHPPGRTPYWTSGQTADRFSPDRISRTVLGTREPLASSPASRFELPADSSRSLRISLACKALTAAENHQRLRLVHLTSGGETDRCHPANQRLPQPSSPRPQRQPRLPPPFPPGTSSSTRKT